VSIKRSLNEISLLKRLLTKITSIDSSVKAVLLFGSMARGEVTERSDVDLLVLHDSCGIEDPVLRRRRFYHLVHEALRNRYEDLTVLDMKLNQFLKPKEITPLLLNLYWDAKVIIDETGKIEKFLEYTRRRILKSGLSREKDGRNYYWKLPQPMTEVSIFEPESP